MLAGIWRLPVYFFAVWKQRQARILQPKEIRKTFHLGIEKQIGVWIQNGIVGLLRSHTYPVGGERDQVGDSWHLLDGIRNGN